MAKKNLDKLKNLVDGWTNVFITDEEVETVAEQRMAICQQCPHKKAIVCGLCDCPLKAKVRAMNDNCPDNRWHKRETP